MVEHSPQILTREEKATAIPIIRNTLLMLIGVLV